MGARDLNTPGVVLISVGMTGMNAGKFQIMG
jgi:hypothetical protein